MDLSPLLASSFILSKLSTNILVSGTTSLGLEHKGIQMHVINDNHYLLPDVETDTDHLTEYLSLGFPGPGLLLLPGSLQLLLPIPPPSNLTICLAITSLSFLLLFLPTVALLQDILIPGNHNSEVADTMSLLKWSLLVVLSVTRHT